MDGNESVSAPSDRDGAAEDASSAVDTCYFMELPGELRNRIYRFVLLQPEDIPVTSSGYERPSVLATSKTIRSEGLKIFYLENAFSIFVHNFDCTEIYRFSQQVKRFKLKVSEEESDVNIHFWTNWAQPNWPNLLLWLKRYHARQLDSWPAHPMLAESASVEDHGEYGVVASMAVVADMLRTKQKWSVVENILKAQHPSLLAYNDGWAEDEDEEEDEGDQDQS
ncbi:hypothetical protein Slin15195_G126270 [Septoria linicola]|uniref:F-box domain-containing protein n=1 Tax=Septoria linicola TaxID=215465 RepID=A0A9Q9B8F7_9PEZI|nr:hypothetical protein Slin14017_G082450 [Septoria linicola]USW59308.1 hypothetical protein Slin15195_G126270 [Septoria linicola]